MLMLRISGHSLAESDHIHDSIGYSLCETVENGICFEGEVVFLYNCGCTE